MNIKFSKSLTVPIYLMVSTSAVIFSPQSLAVECFDTINSPTTLTENLQCELTPENPYALTITGPSGNLYMSGDGGITCVGEAGETGQFGIMVEGTSRQVIGGSVENCPGGILVAGSGLHSILHTQITNFLLDDGIRAESNNNLIQGNIITSNGVDGDDGIDASGDFTTVTQNIINGAGDEGIEINGASASIIQNYTAGSEDDGIDLNRSGATISFNISENNDGGGIVINGNNSYISQNIASNNGDDGIEISDSGSSNTILQNTVQYNGDQGIYIEQSGSVDNVIRGNISTDNVGFDLLDPFADPTCTNLNNTWSSNTANTSDPDCLRFL
ncbi:right-handed parallel beta-helix repeat-containing protein [Microbulbifer sp. SSSA005]|uniref:right-handed parallel beta-helix repeat-containing protein n=1 Tax=Microbulbifer sp. SSSA005 TaxID=3243378 RepID=UPI00403A5590